VLEISGLRVPFIPTQTHQFLYVFPPGVEVFLRLAKMIFVADLFDQQFDQLGNIRSLKKGVFEMTTTQSDMTLLFPPHLLGMHSQFSYSFDERDEVLLDTCSETSNGFAVHNSFAQLHACDALLSRLCLYVFDRLS
jgi:hypothetical protein